MGIFQRLRERAQRRNIEAISDMARHAGRADVADQIDHAIDQPATTLPWTSIATALLPFISAFLTGGSIDFDSLLKSILGLFQQHGIAPAAPATP